MKLKLKTKSGKFISFTKEKTDPLALRVSLGGTPEVGYYMVFRGDDMNQVEEMLTEALESFKQAKIKYNEQMN